jgi:hypothetical protein
MCWSAEVTLFFVALELAACAVLYWQRKTWFILLASGVVMQEAVQLLLWYAIEHDEASGAVRCSAANTVLSLLEQALVVGWVPFAWCISAQNECHRDVELATQLVETERLHASRESTARDAANKWLAGVRHSCAGAWQLSYIMKRGIIVYTSLTLAYSLYGNANGFFRPCSVEGFCTTRGPIGGHQLWPFMEMPLPPCVRRWVHAGGVHFGYEHVSFFWSGAIDSGMPIVDVVTTLFQLGLGATYMIFLAVSGVLVRGHFDSIDDTYRQGWLPHVGGFLFFDLWVHMQSRQD